jgi:hypothetical protein
MATLRHYAVMAHFPNYGGKASAFRRKKTTSAPGGEAAPPRAIPVLTPGGAPTPPPAGTPQATAIGKFIDAEDVSPWETIGSTGVSTINPEEVGDALNRDDLEAFVDGSMVIYTDSSNVSYFRYMPDVYILEVGFKNGAVYRYGNIDVRDAANFVTATSKGGAVWDYLRVRGTLLQHKKPYWRVH